MFAEFFSRRLTPPPPPPDSHGPGAMGQLMVSPGSGRGLSSAQPPKSDPAGGGPRRKLARLPLALVVALLALLVALSPMAPLSPLVPEANAQSTIHVDFIRTVFYDRADDLIYRDYNVQEGATLSTIINFSQTTPADATFTVLAEAGTATPGVDFPAGIHTFTVPSGTNRHKFEIPIPWDAEIEDYETFTLTLQTAPSRYNLRNKTATVQIVNVTHAPSDWTLNPSGLNAGDQYRLLFKTGNSRNSASTSIDDYDAFIRNRPAWHADIKKYADTFRVLGCTVTDKMSASWRTATGVTIESNHPNLPGHTPFTTPIYWVNGMQIASDYNKFWTGLWGNANSHANQRNAAGVVPSTIRGGASTGCLERSDDKALDQQIAGTYHLFSSLGDGNVARGHHNSANADHNSAIHAGTRNKTDLGPYFGLSAVYQVGDFQTSDPVISIEGIVRVREGESVEAQTEFSDPEFTLIASAAPASDRTINLNVREYNATGIDYVDDNEEGDRTIVIPAGQRTVTFTVPTKAMNRNEPDGLVIVSIRPGTGYAIADHTEVEGVLNETEGRMRRSWHATEIHTAQLVSNIGQTGGQDSDGGLNLSRGQMFTTGSHNDGYTVNSVDINFSESSLDDLFRTDNPRLEVTIREVSNGVPGKTVGALMLPDSSPTFAWPLTFTFAAPAKGIKLSPSTKYFVAVDIDAQEPPGRDAKLRLVRSDAERAGGAASFSIANASMYYARSSGKWVSAGANSLIISVNGKLNPITGLVQMSNETRSVAEFGNHRDNGGVRVVVEIGDEMSPKGYARTINFTTDGSAIRGDGKDYTIEGCSSSTCTMRLHANRHSGVLTINVNDDGIDEGDETIVVTLEDGSGYTVNSNRKTFTLTVRDDDTRGLYFSRSWADVDEGASHTYTVRMRSQPTAPVTINIASNNPDVTVTPTALTFNPSGNNPWSRAQTVTVDAAQDSDTVDDTAILTHTTSGGDYGGANALSIGRQVSVEDDDTAAVTPVTQLPIISLTGGAAVTEGSAASFTVNANPAPTSSLTVNVQVMETPGQDFVAAGQERVRTVTLNAGATSTTFTVPTVNDNTDEDDGYVQAFVNDGSGYVAGQGAAVTVRDNDYPTPAVTFSGEIGREREDDGTHEAPVHLTHPAPPGGITLSYSVSGTATRGSDYTVPNAVTINAGERSATIPVAINDDSSFEADAETVILTLIGGGRYTLGSTTVYTLTITDNDVSTQPSLIFVSPYSNAHEGAGVHEVFVDLRNPAPFDGITFSYTVSGTATAGSGNDFTIQNSGTVEVWGGATGAFIPIAINDDSSEESPETVILTLTAGAGYTLGDDTTHTVTIYDNDGITSANLNPVNGSSTLPEGAGFTFNASFTFLKQLPPGGVATLPLTITGTATLGEDYRLTCGSGRSGVVITCSGLDGYSASITFDGSGSSGTVRSFRDVLNLQTLEDNTAESPDETLTLRLGRGSPRTITITDAPSSVAVSFNRATYSISEGTGSMQLIYTVTPVSGRALMIPLIYTDVTATGGADYTSTSHAVLKANGQTNQSHPPFIPILEDTAVEGDETFRVAIDTANLPAGVTAGAITEATITITDNDGSGSSSPSQASPAPTPAQAPAPTPTPTPAPQACNLPADAITVTEVTGWRDALDPNRAAAGIKRWNRVLEAFGVDTGAGVTPMTATQARGVANWLKNTRWDRTARTLEAMAKCNG